MKSNQQFLINLLMKYDRYFGHNEGNNPEDPLIVGNEEGEKSRAYNYKKK